MKLTLDASVYLAALDPNDAASADCQALLQRVHRPSGEPAVDILSPTLLLVEVGASVARALGDATVASEMNQRLRYLPRQTMIPLSELLAEETSRLAAQHEVRGADAVYAAVAQLYGSKLVTLDPRQVEKLADVVTVWSPADALRQLNAAESS